MKQLNTLIQINEIKYITNSLLHEANGYLEIKYFGNEINNKNEIILQATVTKGIEAFEVNLEIKFTYTNECSRCLTKNNKKDQAEFNKSFSLASNNDYDINFDKDSIDLLPIVSEIIISKMEFDDKCKKDCKGLCYICGKDQNEHKCTHKEKNLKESPFSSLSELDL